MPDAIVIPGGGVRPGGVLPPWVAARFDRALEIAGPAWFLPLSAGTPHRPPPLDQKGFPIPEARAGAEYLMARGVDSRRILIEASSFDTVGNAYFSRVIHAMPRKFRRMAVVTSAFHMPRTEAIFRWVYGLDDFDCALEFAETPDTGMEAEALAARRRKEAVALAEIGPRMREIRSLSRLHEWLFTGHAVYSAAGRRGGSTTPDLVTTY